MKEFTEWKQFRDYLIELERCQKEKLFDCYQLIVLPEDCSIPDKVYKKGSLICHSSAFKSYGLSSRCSIYSEIHPNESGELEVLCNGFNCGYLTIKIEKFRRP